jgi:hypothetical protein
MKKPQHINKPDSLDQAIGLFFIASLASGQKPGKNFGK